MTKNSKQEIEQEILAYLQKTSKHLFTDKDNNLFKVLTFKSGEKWYYATIKFNTAEPVVTIREVLSDMEYQYYGNNAPSLVKRNLFPQDHKRISLPNFKKARKLTAEVQALLDTYNDSNKDLIKGQIKALISSTVLEKAV